MTIERAECWRYAGLVVPSVISVYVDAEPGDASSRATAWTEDVRVDRRLCSDARPRQLEPAIARVLNPAAASRGRALPFGATGGESRTSS